MLHLRMVQGKLSCCICRMPNMCMSDKAKMPPKSNNLRFPIPNCSVPGTSKVEVSMCVPGFDRQTIPICIPGFRNTEVQMPCGLTLKYSYMSLCSGSKAIEETVQRVSTLCGCLPEILKGIMVSHRSSSIQSQHISTYCISQHIVLSVCFILDESEQQV